ncbi:MAG: phosphoglycolate phosphatase [Pseudomonadota bacterium]
MPGNAYRVVLFDLDGTLVDTAPDLGFALNQLRQRRGLAPLAEAQIRPQASHGARGLLQLGFGVTPEDAEFRALRQEFLALYEASIVRASRLFPGMAEVLADLEANDIRWGVVTNKPERYTVPLLRGLDLMHRAACVVSGDTCAQPKPHPAPMLHACRLAGAEPPECLYVGDAERDVEAASAAGMPTLIARYGYLGAHDRPEEWGAAGFIDRPADLLRWLEMRESA